MIRIKRHRHGAHAIDITDYVETVSARNAVRQPWGSISLTMVAPMARLGGIAARGDVLVVNDGDDVVLGWGIVPSQSQRHVAGPPLSLRDRDVMAVSWLDYLADVEVVRALGRNETVGTMFNMNDWARVLEASLSRLSGDIGPTAAAVVKALARVKIPETLGGGVYGEQVRVVYNAETADGFESEITLDPVLGPSIGGFQTSMPLGGMVLAMVLASIGGDPRIIEMYPTTVWSPSSGGDITSALGARPILVHRLVPWRHEPVVDWELKFQRYAYRNAPFGSLPAIMDDATAQRFNAITWPTARHFAIKQSDIYMVSRSEATSADYNAVTVGFPNAPDSEVRFQEESGLPVIVPEAVDRYGLRLFDIQWPFYTNTDAVGGLSADTRYINGLAWQGAQWYLGAGRFQSGNVNARYAPRAMPGESFSAQLPGGFTLEAYADAVTHTATVTGSEVGHETSVDFSRGVVAEPGMHAEVRSTPFEELR